ncbi:hypothetical protein BKA64DRAFT_642552 [Cadophora sp. MPI-SDFR-AT-0126]|nr:hypothetical protein BKA64DRAFT_642552 [Leotiomycetes sp. MPI-SDFR-AT-0126]
MKLSLITVVAGSFGGLVNAADCTGPGLFWPESYYWDLRQWMCNNEKCPYQEPCRRRVRSSLVADDVNLSADTPSPYRNIITQCKRNGYGYGTWGTGEEFYRFGD